MGSSTRTCRTVFSTFSTTNNNMFPLLSKYTDVWKLHEAGTYHLCLLMQSQKLMGNCVHRDIMMQYPISHLRRTPWKPSFPKTTELKIRSVDLGVTLCSRTGGYPIPSKPKESSPATKQEHPKSSCVPTQCPYQL